MSHVHDIHAPRGSGTGGSGAGGIATLTGTGAFTTTGATSNSATSTSTSTSTSTGAGMEHDADRMGAQLAAMPLRTGGQPAASGPLAPALRQELANRFGHDFSRVRIHADAGTAQMADALGAAAFTFGNDVVFNSGLFAPESQGGRALLGHELTHVVQQQRLATPSVQRKPLGGGGDDAQATLVWESYRQSLTLDGFDSDSASLTPAHVAQLDAWKVRAQTLLGLYPESFFTVTGHTDATESDAYNKALGQRRADAVKATLTGGDYPVPVGLVNAGSLGETALAVPAKGREARNRRVTITPTLRRRALQLALPSAPTTLAPTGGFGPVGPLGPVPGTGTGLGPGRGTVPDPFGPQRPALPDLNLPRTNWIEEGLKHDPVLRELPSFLRDKVIDALKDGDEKAAEKIIDALPMDDKYRGALQAFIKATLQTMKGEKWKMPEAPPRMPDFGPKQVFPLSPGQVLIPSPTFKW
jgi:outer membrane protein OmpA-like peptidoglycan-associated protein